MNSISSTTPQIYNNTSISNNIQNVAKKAEHTPENIGDSVSINSSSSDTKEITRNQIQAQTKAEETPTETVAKPEEEVTEETNTKEQNTKVKPAETETVQEEETKTKQKPKLKEKLAELGDQALVAYFSVQGSIDSFPAFIYPAVTGATAEQAEFTYKVLDKLPMKDVTSVSNIEWVPELFMSTDKTAHASGVAYSALSPYIKIAEDECGDLGKWAEKVIIHETGHTRDYSEGILSNFA